MTYDLPASYDPTDNRIVALPQAIIPIVAGRLHTLEYESSWETNKAAGVQAALLVQERLITPYTDASGYALPANYAATDNRLVAIPKALISIVNQRLLDLIAPAAWIAEDATAGPEAISLLQDRLEPEPLTLITTTGSFVGIIQKTGIPLVWDTGDGGTFTGNNPNWMYEDAAVRVVQATSDEDGWGGVTQITLAGLQLASVTLPYMMHLTLLYLYNNQISDITPLAAMTKLTSLYLNLNQISDITPLAAMTKLRYLQLQGNQISDITPLAAMTNLMSLFMHQNQISDITPLAAMTKLTSLILYSNQISDITPLWNNRIALGANRCSIDLRFNPLSSLALSQVNDLRAAGCTVTV